MFGVQPNGSVMKHLLNITVLLLSCGVLSAQNVEGQVDLNESVRTEELHKLIGTKRDVRLLFVGDEVRQDSVVNSQVKHLWEKLDAKIDFVIVFSDEMEESVQSVTGAVVIRAYGDYSDYFASDWNSMRKWMFLELKEGDVDEFITTAQAHDLVKE